jgi:hypothetical protein
MKPLLVIVDVELRLWIRKFGFFKCKLDEVLAKYLTPDRFTKGPIFF